VNLYGARRLWYQYGGGRPRSALYGLWDIDQFSLDVQMQALTVTDATLWPRAIFDLPSALIFQRMDSSLQSFTAAINTTKQGRSRSPKLTT
jgi:hypothetical protein